MKAKRDLQGKGKVHALFALAQKKGLKIQGLSITLPNGHAYLAKDIADLRDFVKGY